MEDKYFIVRGTRKKQERDGNGRFLPKKRKYIIKTCPKVLYSTNLSDSKLFKSFSRANYALHGISGASEREYDFDIVQVNVRFEESE